MGNFVSHGGALVALPAVGASDQLLAVDALQVKLRSALTALNRCAALQ